MKLLEMHTVRKFTFLPRLIIYSKNMISIQFDNRVLQVDINVVKVFLNLKVVFSTMWKIVLEDFIMILC